MAKKDVNGLKIKLAVTMVHKHLPTRLANLNTDF